MLFFFLTECRKKIPYEEESRCLATTVSNECAQVARMQEAAQPVSSTVVLRGTSFAQPRQMMEQLKLGCNDGVWPAAAATSAICASGSPGAYLDRLVPHRKPLTPLFQHSQGTRLLKVQ